MSRSHYYTLLYSFDKLSLPGIVVRRILEVFVVKTDA